MADGGRHTADSALVVELASGATVRDAAKEARVSERTSPTTLSFQKTNTRVRTLPFRVVMSVRVEGLLYGGSATLF